MALEIRQQRTEWLAAVRLGLLRVLLTLARDWDWPADHDGMPSVHSHDLARIMPALRMVESRLERRVSREEGARACGLSVRQFAHVFRHVMGVSFGTFALRARLASAAHHLLYTDLSIEAIASETGFVDGAHLHHMFEKQFGQTPAQYRRDGRQPVPTRSPP
jgi:transcriptional regulator GlxA family with amidase domain